MLKKADYRPKSSITSMYPYIEIDSTSNESLSRDIGLVLDRLRDPQVFSAHFPDGRVEKLTTYEEAISLISKNPAIVVRVD